MIAEVCSLFSGLMAAGGLIVSSAMTLPYRLPSGFVRFCASASAIAAAAAALLGAGPTRWVWAALSLVALGWYAWLRSRESESRTVSALVTITAGLTPIVWAGASPLPREGLAMVGSVSSALLLGTVTVTMILGHWYLVDTNLSIAPLRVGALWMSAAVTMRILVVGFVLIGGGFGVLRIERLADLVFSTNALFFLFRSVVGLGAPIVLSALIWQTVKMRSTQSATGLLYVALIVVLFGELVSHFLFLATGYPL